MKKLRVRDVLTMTPEDQTISLSGWVRTKRDSKSVTFFELNDGSCLANVQVIVDRADDGSPAEALDAVQTGAAVEITGTLVASPGQGQSVEIHGTQVTVVGPAPADSYPLQKKRHSFEYLREIAHLRPRTNTFGAIARVRHAVSFAIHRFFHERGFIYVHTPLITSSDAEGAGELFRVTTLSPAEKHEDLSEDFFGKPSFLTVSGQLNVETYAQALERVYTFGPAFRAENSNTSRHLAELWMIEPEIAFCDLHCCIDLAEEFIKVILQSLLQECPEDMAFFDKRIRPGIIEELQRVMDTPFRRLTYTEAIEILEASGKEFEFPVRWGGDLQSEHERYLAEEHFNGPVVLTDYPKDIKAFYMRRNDDGRTVAAMDVLVPHLGEIVGGSQREERLDRLEGRIDESGLPKEAYWWYLDLRRFGSVPHSGFGLGLDRFVQYVTGMQNIRDVIPFPRTVGNLSF
ncbi:MAG: asparagine--tRNA ligase [Spirochaetota bacterium]